jgi:S1-C subfamily serine protease
MLHPSFTLSLKKNSHAEGWVWGLVCLFILLVCSVASAQNKKEEALAEIFSAVVGVQTTVPVTARTSEALGTERSGSGVVIDNNGLIVTIGYLILEAANAEVTLADGQKVAAEIVAYDHNTGFGLLRTFPPIAVTPMTLGSAAGLGKADPVLVVVHGGGIPVRPAYVVARREFAGYWEYLLDNAIFTSPPHPRFSGAALVGPQGTLLGIGSLFVGDALRDDRPLSGNMFVPIDLLRPILKDLQTNGRTQEPSRPWLGVQTEEVRGYLFITRVASEGPSAKAGLKPGEIITAVAGKAVSSMADFYRELWNGRTAGDDVVLTVLKGTQLQDIKVRSGDRYAWLRLTPSY